MLNVPSPRVKMEERTSSSQTKEPSTSTQKPRNEQVRPGHVAPATQERRLYRVQANNIVQKHAPVFQQSAGARNSKMPEIYI